MFDLGASELLLTVIVAIIVIGPKDLPRALRTAGGWLGKLRRVSGHFRSGIEEMIRQAEMEDMEKKWREKNEAIMREHAEGSALPAPGGPAPGEPAPASAEAAVPPPAGAPDADSDSYPADPYGDMHPMISPPPAATPAEAAPSGDAHGDAHADTASPELPLASPKAQP